MKKAQSTLTQRSKSKKPSRAKAQKSVPAAVGAALTGTTGLALIGTAVAGVGGFFAWKNREKILEFVGKYIDLPKSLKNARPSSTDQETWETNNILNSVTSDSYSKPSSEHRM
jgi:hypothetical protein